MATQTFDPDSGQVFSETIVGAKKAGKRWERWEQSYPSRLSRPLTSASGGSVKSLQDICLQKLAVKANSLQVETLEGLPKATAIRIWQYIRKEWRESFHVWRAFVKAGFWEWGLSRMITKDTHNVRLVPFLDSLSDPLGAWMVDLTLKNVALTAAEFKEVSRLANVQQLQVQYTVRATSSNFDDRIVKAWSIRAKRDGAFSRLESLSVVNASGITSNVIQHLPGFPSLGNLVLAGNASVGRRAAKVAHNYGWTEAPLQSTARSQRLFYEPDSPWEGMRSVLDSVKGQLPQPQTNVPRVDVLLQSPPATSRVVGESHVFRYQCIEGFAPAASTEHADLSVRPVKQRKLNGKKSSEYTSMLAQMQ